MSLSCQDIAFLYQKHVFYFHYLSDGKLIDYTPSSIKRIGKSNQYAPRLPGFKVDFKNLYDHFDEKLLLHYLKQN